MLKATRAAPLRVIPSRLRRTARIARISPDCCNVDEADRRITMSDLTRAAMAGFVFIFCATCAFAAALVMLN
jgi:hypothetical protein